METIYFTAGVAIFSAILAGVLLALYLNYVQWFEGMGYITAGAAVLSVGMCIATAKYVNDFHMMKQSDCIIRGSRICPAFYPEEGIMWGAIVLAGCIVAFLVTFAVTAVTVWIAQMLEDRHHNGVGVK